MIMVMMMMMMLMMMRRRLTMMMTMLRRKVVVSNNYRATHYVSGGLVSDSNVYGTRSHTIIYNQHLCEDQMALWQWHSQSAQYVFNISTLIRLLLEGYLRAMKQQHH